MEVVAIYVIGSRLLKMYKRTYWSRSDIWDILAKIHRGDLNLWPRMVSMNIANKAQGPEPMERTERIFLGLGIVVTAFSACMPVMVILLFNLQSNMADRFLGLSDQINDLSTRIGRIEGRLQIPVSDDVDAEHLSLTADSLGIAAHVLEESGD